MYKLFYVKSMHHDIIYNSESLKLPKDRVNYWGLIIRVIMVYS